MPDAISAISLSSDGEPLRADCIKAWMDYQATGLHVTAEEADQWLEKLERGGHVDPPPCHT